MDYEYQSRVDLKHESPELETRNHVEYDDRRFSRNIAQFPLYKKRNDKNKEISGKVQ